MVFTHIPVRRSVAVGIAGVVIGYAISYVVGATVTEQIQEVMISPAVAGIDPTPLSDVFGYAPSVWTVSGWLYYNAHGIPTSVPSAGVQNGVYALTNVNLIFEIWGISTFLFLLPPVLLIGGGYVAMEWGEMGSASAFSGGASVAIGYFPMMLLGSFVFSAGVGRVTASPAGLLSVFIPLIYSIVFGGLGGMMAARVRSDEVESNGRSGSFS